jgi:hypothetical protein
MSTRVSTRVLGAVVVGIVAVVALWWLWPTLAGDDRTGVLVVDDGFLAPGRRSLELRTRETGRTVRWDAFDQRWCADPGPFEQLVDDVDPQVVVVAVGDTSCASTVTRALAGRRVVLVEERASGGLAALERGDAEVVDPARLLGPADPDLRLDCEWWESCDIDGRIAVRDAVGVPNAAGQERIARMIVAAL